MLFAIGIRGEWTRGGGLLRRMHRIVSTFSHTTLWRIRSSSRWELDHQMIGVQCSELRVQAPMHSRHVCNGDAEVVPPAL